MKRIMECVPNFSEGRDKNVIRQIADAIGSVSGVKVLNVDPGEAANRTVITFAGEPEAVAEAAFLGVKTAQQLIDMSRHHGTHPRIGATDVLPFVPVSGITLDECAMMARQLGRRMADELGIPVYLYEAAALRPKFRNLAVCRAGEYEGIAHKLSTPGEEPDYMPPTVPCGSPQGPLPAAIRRSGISVVGARDFLIAVNFNLNTTSKEIATAIARQVRERGYQGQPGTLKCVKAIGWYIEEYGFAQVSCNLTNFRVTSLRQTFDEVSRVAQLHGVSVTGTEIIGLVPEEALFPDAVRLLGLNQLQPFRMEEKVIEYLIP
ncbi:MAG: glutamate formimidoyltransferase [Bacteroidaceae bacterium]|nr:glutamate formimidoyltransferase [Bacteroidaceae bacterium]